MRGLTCRRVSILIGHGIAALSEAERLVVESHLSECRSCQEDVSMDESLRGLQRTALRDLTARSRERAVANALSREQVLQKPTGVRVVRPWHLMSGLAVVAGGVVAIILTTSTDEGAAAARVLAGSVSINGASGDIDQPIPDDAVVTSESKASVSLQHAQVAMSPNTTMVWRANPAEIELRQGSVSVSVDPGAKKTFRVSTKRFVVEVVGTEFAVDLGGVQVTHGAVRIKSPSGDLLVGLLSAGDVWRVDKTTASTPMPTRPPPAPATSPTPPAPAPVTSPTPPAAAGATGPRVAKPTARTWLARAKRHLGTGKVAAARSATRRALQARPTRTQAAEARTLLAECALATGNTSGAIRLYVEVARRYRNLRAGEIALFAAARLSGNVGRKAKARELLRRYLQRYPRGRFAADAQRKLRALEPRK